MATPGRPNRLGFHQFLCVDPRSVWTVSCRHQGSAAKPATWKRRTELCSTQWGWRCWGCAAPEGRVAGWVSASHRLQRPSVLCSGKRSMTQGFEGAAAQHWRRVVLFCSQVGFRFYCFTGVYCADCGNCRLFVCCLPLFYSFFFFYGKQGKSVFFCRTYRTP